MSDSENEPVNEQQHDESSGSEVEEDNDDIGTEKEYEGGAIKKKIITQGQGLEKPKSGADVTVHYVGTLLDGTQFDSSRDRGTPFNFKLGQGMVIKGWDKGVATMKKGEKALFTIAASHAYGERGQGAKIPPNATLQFEVELLSWTSEEDVTKGGEVKKTIIQEGKGWEKPGELSSCTVKYSCKAGGQYVIGGETPVEATIELSAVDTPEGLVEALKKMKKGERATVTVAASYGYGKEGNSGLKIAPDTDLVYDIELVEFPESPKTYTMKHEEKLAHGNKIKEVGNAFFKKDKFSRAQHFYKEAAEVFQHEMKNLEGAVKKQAEQLTEAAKGNLAACSLKLGMYAETIQLTTEVLELDDGNVKALFRRAQAHYARKDFDEAMEDLKAVIEKEGKTSAAVAKLLKEVKVELAKERNEQAKIYGGMFSKISLVSDKEVAEAQARAAAAAKPAMDSSDDDEPPAMDEEAQKAEEPAKEPAKEPVKEPVKEAAKAEEAPAAKAEGEEEEEEMTPEQAAAMAAMNDELFGIVEEGQAGLAADAPAKAEEVKAKDEPKEEVKPKDEPKEEVKPKEEKETPKSEEPAVTVHVPAAADAKGKAAATAKGAAKAADNKKPAAKGKGKK